MASRACWCLVAALAAAGWSCGGSPATGPSSSGPAPTPTQQPGPAGGPLPYGQASGADVSCPAGSPAGSACIRLVVSCPDVPPATAVVQLTRPEAAVTNRGTVVLTTGGAGTLFNRTVSVLGSSMIAAFAAEGLLVADVAWDAPGVWGGPQARTLACRSATLLRWVHDNLHTGGRSRLFAAQGTSGGAAQIAFALAHYGASDFLDLANLGGGPPWCPPTLFCSAEGQRGPEPLLPSAPPAVNRQPLLAYPATVVRFFLGAEEPSPQIAADARGYYEAITSAKSFMSVPGTGHHIEDTQAGVNAFIASVRGAVR